MWQVENQEVQQGTSEDEGCPGGGRAPTEIPLLVKTLKDTASKAQRETFLKEALSFHGIAPHPNVSQVVAAAVWSSEDPTIDTPLLCYYASGYGNLKKFLLRCRGLEQGFSTNLHTQDLVFMGLQIIRGMLHLHRHRVLHRDLAARNCL